MPSYKKKPEKELAVARQKIAQLFEQAEIHFSKDPSLSNKDVKLARKLAMKYKLKMPRPFKRRFCKHCYVYLVPNKNCRVRIRNNTIIYSCFSCKNFMRFGYKKKRGVSNA